MSIAAVFGRGGSFYDGTPGHELVKCPDCGLNADALFGDHGGDCRTGHSLATPVNALGIILNAARTRPTFSMNNLRAAFNQAGIPKESRGPAFSAAQKKNPPWIEVEGHEPSTDEATKGSDVKVYRSLLYVGARVA
jgi:hypothetical protein